MAETNNNQTVPQNTRNQGAIGDSSDPRTMDTDLNGASTAVGVPQQENHAPRRTRLDLPIDASGELTDYDVETPPRVEMPPDADAGESFTDIVDVGRQAQADITRGRKEGRGSEAEGEELQANLVGEEAPGVGGILDNFRDEIKEEHL